MGTIPKVDLDKANTKLLKLDIVLDTVDMMWSKHWGKSIAFTIIGLVVWFGYEVYTTPDEDIHDHQHEQHYEVHQKK